MLKYRERYLQRNSQTLSTLREKLSAKALEAARVMSTNKDAEQKAPPPPRKTKPAT